MNIRNHPTLARIIGLLLMGALWFVIAPQQVGGQAAYIIIHGNSMEPLYYTGDLVVLRAAGTYTKGDIVAYRHPQIGPVIHRIVESQGDRLVFKGDHNNFIDPYQPTADELIGKAWLHISSVGNGLIWLRQPFHFFVFMLGIVVMGIYTMRARTNQRSTRQRLPQRPATAPSGASPLSTIDIARGTCTLLAIVSLALAVFFFMQPTTREVHTASAYQQTGMFHYTGTLPSGSANLLSESPDQPIFRTVSDAMQVSFDYQFVTDTSAHLKGSYRLRAELSGTDGWKHSIDLQPQHTFVGTAFSAHDTIDLKQLQTLIDQLESQTMVNRSQYQLTLAADVAVDGTLAENPLQETFAPHITFLLDDLELQLMSGSDDSDVLQPKMQGVIKQTSSEPNLVAPLGVTLPIAEMRYRALFGFGLGVLGMAGLSIPRTRTAQPDEHARIRYRYDRLLITAVENDPVVQSLPTIQVATIEDLARLATTRGTAIVHAQSGTNNRYLVHDGALWYAYQPPAESLAGVLPCNETDKAVHGHLLTSDIA